MSEKKGFWKSLFGGSSGGGCCNMEITEEPQKKGGCCDMEIIEENGESTGEDTDAPIQVLGAGCRNCVTLEQNVKAALTQMGKTDAVAHITDYHKIMAYGVMSVPALVIKGKVVSVGKVLKPAEIIKLMEENL